MHRTGRSLPVTKPTRTPLGASSRWFAMYTIAHATCSTSMRGSGSTAALVGKPQSAVPPVAGGGGVANVADETGHLGDARFARAAGVYSSEPAFPKGGIR
jgi:hypothetical protein